MKTPITIDRHASGAQGQRGDLLVVGPSRESVEAANLALAAEPTEEIKP